LKYLEIICSIKEIFTIQGNIHQRGETPRANAFRKYHYATSTPVSFFPLQILKE
jgi:hypothetical protein